MLEFNQNHKIADISSVKQKLIKTGGKVLLCGTLISSILLLSGCGGKKEDNLTQIATAIIITNDNALLMDLSDYVWSYSSGRDVAHVENMDGNELIVGNDDIIIIDGENSYQKAEQIAEALVGENGEVIRYDEIKNYSKRK